MSLVEIQNRLSEVTGIQAASMGGNIQNAVGRRMLALGLKDAGDYTQTALSSYSELQELIEEVVVAETWFFRDRKAFNAMSEFAVAWWLLSSASNATLSVLSVPCSSGEEPYSIAMALVDSGLPLERFRVDALDISLQALARARYAVYGSNSFREGELGFRDRFFRATPDGHELAEPMRNQVKFFHGNILAPRFYVGTSKYDIIFCRNLLIYFDVPTQKAVLKTLDGLLADSGILFLGSAESFRAMRCGFASANYAGAYAVQKKGPKPVRPKTQSPPSSASASATARARKDSRSPEDETVSSKARNESGGRPAFGLERATKLADAGLLTEAAEICEDYLRLNEPSADAYYILGLVRDAQDRPAQAEGYYRKALYLEPNHRGALTQLSLAANREGDSAGAARLRNRAKRPRGVK